MFLATTHPWQRQPWRTAALLLVLSMLFAIATAAEKGDISRPNIYARQQQDTQPTSSSSSSSPTSSATSSSSSSTPVPVSPPSPVQAPAQKPGSTGGTVIGPGGIIIQPHSGNSTSNSTIIGPNSVIDPRRPVSRLSMVQPKQNTVNPPLFPVGSNIVFDWLFDNATLVFPPANLTVEISLTSNPKMIWPVANVSGTATSVVWSTATVTNPSLFMGYYTLSVYDTKIGKQGVATSGHLMPYSDLQFGMYIPEPYVPRTGAFCQTCSHGVKLQWSHKQLSFGAVLSVVSVGIANLIVN